MVPEDPHYIRRRGGWFRPRAEGYTVKIAEAGIFSGGEARLYKAGCDDIVIYPAAAVRVDLVDEIVRMREALSRAEAVLATLPVDQDLTPSSPD